VSSKKTPKPPEPSSGSIEAVPDTDQVVLTWHQWNQFSGSARTSGREAMALVALLAQHALVKTLMVYSVSPTTDRAEALLYSVNYTALRAHRGEDA
jgi:hypothetical protein